MQTPEEHKPQPGNSLAEHLVLLCTGGAGRTSMPLDHVPVPFTLEEALG